MKRSVQIIAVVLLALTASALSVAAETIDDLKAAVAAYERNKICPKGAYYDIHKYADFCKQYCDQSRVCNKAAQDPCEAGDRAGCKALADGSLACMKQMNQENATILAYDRIVEHCPGFPGGAAGPDEAKATLQSQQQAQSDVESALGETTSTEASAKLHDLDETADKNDKKQEVNAVSAACDSRVQACRRRYRSLPYLKDATRQQCDAYCNNLGIERCASSETIKMAVNACNDQATSDYKEAVAAWKAARKQEQDDEARNQPAQPAPQPAPQATDEWTCFPSYETCTGYCMQQTGASGTAGWCGGICSGDGTGNRPQPSQYSGQYCYHAPVTAQEKASVY